MGPARVAGTLRIAQAGKTNTQSKPTYTPHPELFRHAKTYWRNRNRSEGQGRTEMLIAHTLYVAERAQDEQHTVPT